jgi:alpha-1,3-mannosyltransferase
MQEVEGFLNGERDYTKLRGDTGPLVYPAGFLFIFSVLRSLTDSGTNIFFAQCLFAVIYVLCLIATLNLYLMDGGFSLLTCALLVLSKRIHSIFVLRMFNDCIALLFGLCALNCFVSKKWKFGCFIYSVAVSIKMNMLLYSPGLLLILLINNSLFDTAVNLSICALVQIIVGFPFLSTYPIEYFKKSFELDRVFMHQWTVNLKFLPEDIFVSKRLSVILLLCTIAGF